MARPRYTIPLGISLKRDWIYLSPFSPGVPFYLTPDVEILTSQKCDGDEETTESSRRDGTIEQKSNNCGNIIIFQNCTIKMNNINVRKSSNVQIGDVAKVSTVFNDYSRNECNVVDVTNENEKEEDNLPSPLTFRRYLWKLYCISYDMFQLHYLMGYEVISKLSHGICSVLLFIKTAWKSYHAK